MEENTKGLQRKKGKWRNLAVVYGRKWHNLESSKNHKRGGGEMNYKVSMNNIEYLLAQEITANSKEEAIQKYQEKFEQGEIQVIENDLVDIEVKEVNK